MTDQNAKEQGLRRDRPFSALRWPHGARCPHCSRKTRVTRLCGEAHRGGLYKCARCRRQFSATSGTPFTDSHLSDEQIGRAFVIHKLFRPWGRVTRIARALGVAYTTALRLNSAIEEWNQC